MLPKKPILFLILISNNNFSMFLPPPLYFILKKILSVFTVEAASLKLFLIKKFLLLVRAERQEVGKMNRGEEKILIGEGKIWIGGREDMDRGDRKGR